MSLPTPQLEQVIVALNAPRGNIPTAAAQPASRVAALFEWVESPVGCGLATLNSVLDEVTASAQREPSVSSPLQGLGNSVRQDIQIGESVSGSGIISGDGNTVQIHHYYGLPEEKPAATRKDRNEKILIDAVWTEVEDRLRQSLHNAILVRLDMAEQRNQVSRPWDSQLRTADQNPKKLPPGTHIVDVFDRRDVGGKLLILGNPGSGKTTTMLDLAAVLIQRANDNLDQPIPVMVNLSSWQNAKQSLTNWLVSELKLKYGVSQKLGQTWLQEKLLLPLLDGLDELPPVRQEPVVKAINDWLQSGDGPTGLLVCSRIEEYELYETNLGLNGAVCLEPLTDNQLQQYLKSLNCQDLWATLRHDEDLLTLVRTPLLLSVAVLANDSIDHQRWHQKQTTTARMEYLLDAYIERRLHEVINSKEYAGNKQPTARQTRHWLIWLAKQIKHQSQDEFLIEQLQPSLLTTRKQKLIYGLIFGLIFGLIGGLILGLILGLIFGLIFGLIGGLIFGLIYGLILGLIAGLIAGQSSIDPIESFDLSFSRLARKDFVKELRNGLIGGLIGGLIAGLILGLIYGLILGLIYGLIGGLILGLIYGLITGLIYGLIEGLKSEIANRVVPNQGIFKAAKNILPVSLITYPGGILIALGGQLARFVADNGLTLTSLELDFTRALLEGIAYAVLIGGYQAGWQACVEHFSLRLVLYRAGYIPWNYARFLNHCTERLLLQRVGGRYRFIHKLVQEHFAAMPLKSQ